MKIIRLVFYAAISFALIMASGQYTPSSPVTPAKKNPHIVFVSGDHEYSSEETFPILARELASRYRFRTTVLKSFPDENAETNLPGLETLNDADVAVLFLRWRQLPEEQLGHLEKYLASGKPIVAFRTTTHAFNYPKGHKLESWNRFAADYLGAPPGWGNGHYHYGHLSSTDVSILPAAASHPILKGVDVNFHVTSWLYHIRPGYPPKDAELLLMGHSVNPENRPGRTPEDNPVAWTWKNKSGAKVFVTTLGHPEDFRAEAFQHLVINGIHWAAGKAVPKKFVPIQMDVKYHGIRKK
jgi:type 1 glutamine amidotransferase